MKKLLLVITMLSLVGCGEASADNEVPLWHDNITLVKKFDRSGGIWMSSKGNCYLKYSKGYHGGISKVDCEDFNVDVGNHLTKESSTVTDSSTALLEYIMDYCVVNDEHKDFPRVEGTTSVIEELQGKQLSCKLPDNIDSSLSERAEYLRLKKKFGG
ncbi:hypothetical protein AXI76_gp206 [Pseudoalteromonas phage H101]|uniref:Lipoprotein n=1 Tax=Pseudoalteromonas phage H101 TaxID=1654919 RepID=A0A0H4IP34_9CAUD|nr:hypothetical protein AXI76_gp206 [Pseudoalteromonas phage H101]AKO61107.1 hypothetical protein [Pseudoalteromonas phage H101]